MFDRSAVSERFFLHYSGMSRGEVARIFGASRTYVTQWATQGIVPWSRLKYLSDSQSISWDWLLEGIEPQKSAKEAKTPRSTSPKFNRAGINRRFLSLFANMTQTQIAALLDISTSTVHDWTKNKSQVPWKKLQDAVDTFGVRWDWLIDGLEPKLRTATTQ